VLGRGDGTPTTSLGRARTTRYGVDGGWVGWPLTARQPALCNLIAGSRRGSRLAATARYRALDSCRTRARVESATSRMHHRCEYGRVNAREGDTVFVFGAGFSRAISDQLPLTDRLGDLVVERIADHDPDAPRGGFKGGYFEAWLSRLADDQPDLDPADNLLNRSMFARVTGAIYDIVTEREFKALKDTPPSWLLSLLGILHARRMTAITFNYDTLLERAVANHYLFNWQARRRVQPADIVDHIPPAVLLPGVRFSSMPTDSLLLLKLHGSTDVYWVPNDSTGATINRWELFGRWGDPESVDSGRRRRELPGREPFIVPPAASKSSYYLNPITQHLWRRAAEKLGFASRVVFLGYSLPPTDLVTSGMLGSHLSRDGVRVDVVDTNPSPVRKRLLALGVEAKRIKIHGGGDPIRAFIDALELEEARRTVQELRNDKDNHTVPVLVAWGEAFGAAVIGVQTAEDNRNEIELLTEKPTPLQVATRLRAPTDSQPVCVNDILKLLGRGGTLVALLPDGRRGWIIDRFAWQTDVGQGSGSWQLLVPSIGPV